MESFLTQKERTTVQRIYQKWLEHLKPNDIVGMLYTEGVISEREKQEYDVKHTNYDRAEHLFSCCLMRATYPDIQKIRKILIETEQPGLAAGLPVRPEFERNHGGQSTSAGRADHSTYIPQPPQGGRPNQPPPPNMNRPTAPQAYNHMSRPDQRQDQPNHQTPHGHPPPQAHTNTSRPSPYSDQRGNQQHHQTAPGPQPQVRQPNEVPPQSRPNPIPPPSSFGGGPTPRTPNPAPPPPNWPTNPSAQPPLQQNQPPQFRDYRGTANNNIAPGPPPESRLRRYPTRDGTPSGKGYCLIIANLTAKYQGYREDITLIENFFKDELVYEVRTCRDKCRDEMKEILRSTVRQINRNTLYDRFFLFVMSEGKDDTIYGSNARGDSVDSSVGQGDRYFPCELPMGEVVKMFTHEKVPGMREFPKVFFFQTCPTDISQAAGSTESQMSGLVQSAASADNQLAVGADTFVCKAVQSAESVTQHSSWLIEHLIAIFKQYYKQEHFVDMITQLNFELARRTDALTGRVGQVLDVSHSLTEKFYLWRS